MRLIILRIPHKYCFSLSIFIVLVLLFFYYIKGNKIKNFFRKLSFKICKSVNYLSLEPSKQPFICLTVCIAKRIVSLNIVFISEIPSVEFFNANLNMLSLS